MRTAESGHARKAKDNLHVLYIQKAKTIEMFIYIFKNPDTLQKARQFALRFYSQKARHFKLHDFP